MKSIYLIFLIVFSTLALAEMSVYHADPDNVQYSVDMQLSAGWNLVPGLCNTAESMIRSSSLELIFFLDPYAQEFVNIYNDPHTYNEDRLSVNEQLICGSAWWAYTPIPTSLDYRTDFMALMDDRVLKRGWNFVTITPEMLNLEIQEFTTDCNIEKAYYWMDAGQRWEKVGLHEYADESSIGKGLVLKATSECTMNSRISPPDLPG